VPGADGPGGFFPKCVADRECARIDDDRWPPGFFLLIKRPRERAKVGAPATAGGRNTIVEARLRLESVKNGVLAAGQSLKALNRCCTEE
jgi:hypothetical protein